MLDQPRSDTEGEAPEEVLHRVFGHPAFRGRQEEIVRHVMAGGSGLVLMPTGGGKSLCFQVPALCRPGLGVVVSPLIALMEDQVAALRQQGVAAAALHSDLPEDQAREVKRDLARGAIKLLYVSPERLLLDGTLDFLATPAARAVRHRRGALRQPVGPPLPAGISRARPAGDALPRTCRGWR